MERLTLGILGGAFDPPHAGHVALARAAVEELALERLLVLVVADPGHRGVVAPAETRLALARLAFADVPGVDVVLDDHARTVDYLEAEKPANAVLVLGADELVGFHAWKQPERVLELARLAVAKRPGVTEERLQEARARLPHPERVVFFDLAAVDVSSTDVRARAARGEPLDGLVPPAVAAEIERLGLYRGE